MKVSESFLLLKNQTAQQILSLEDAAVLAKICAILNPTPQYILDGIDRGLVDLAAGRHLSADEFLQEVKEL